MKDTILEQLNEVKNSNIFFVAVLLTIILIFVLCLYFLVSPLPENNIWHIQCNMTQGSLLEYALKGYC